MLLLGTESEMFLTYFNELEMTANLAMFLTNMRWKSSSTLEASPKITLILPFFVSSQQNPNSQEYH